MQNELDALRQRVVRLELANRRLATVSIAVAAAFVLAAAQRPAADVQRARAFEVVDESGDVRAALRFDDGAPQLVLLDEGGVARATVVHEPDQTGLFLRDAEGTVRLGAAQFAHGGGGYALHGESSKGAAVVYLKGSKGSLAFYDAEGGLMHRVPAKPPSD